MTEVFPQSKKQASRILNEMNTYRASPVISAKLFSKLTNLQLLKSLKTITNLMISLWLMSSNLQQVCLLLINQANQHSTFLARIRPPKKLKNLFLLRQLTKKVRFLPCLVCLQCQLHKNQQSKQPPNKTRPQKSSSKFLSRKSKLKINFLRPSWLL